MDNEVNRNNTENIDDIEAVLGVFNNPNHEIRRKQRNEEERKIIEYAAKRAANRNLNKQQAQRAINKTVGNNKVTEDFNRRQNPSIKKGTKFEKLVITLCSITCAFSLLIPAGLYVKPILDERAEIQANIDKSTDLLIAKAMNNLTYHDLAGIDINTGKFVIKDNTVEDYKKLGITSELDVYIYKQILSPGEFSDFIKSVSYNDGLHRYLSMEQFLTINGYYENGTRIPSMEVFNNAMERKIKELSPELAAQYDIGDGVFSVADLIEETNMGKGGR